VGSLSQFEEYGDPLLRGHLSAAKGIRGIGFLEGVENADYFLHNLILRWLSHLGDALLRGRQMPTRVPLRRWGESLFIFSLLRGS
jgi:hypothetical protein